MVSRPDDATEGDRLSVGPDDDPRLRSGGCFLTDGMEIFRGANGGLMSRKSFSGNLVVKHITIFDGFFSVGDEPQIFC